MDTYENYQNEQINALGFDPAKLNSLQKEILLQPMEAPENYHHDGEVTPTQAKTIWEGKLKKAGFSTLQIFNIKRKMSL